MKKNFVCEMLTNILLKIQYVSLLHDDLENRLKLSRALSGTLLELHLVDWVHDGLDFIGLRP